MTEHSGATPVVSTWLAFWPRARLCPSLQLREHVPTHSSSVQVFAQRLVGYVPLPRDLWHTALLHRCFHVLAEGVVHRGGVRQYGGHNRDASCRMMLRARFAIGPVVRGVPMPNPSSLQKCAAGLPTFERWSPASGPILPSKKAFSVRQLVAPGASLRHLPGAPCTTTALPMQVTSSAAGPSRRREVDQSRRRTTEPQPWNDGPRRR